MSTIAVANPCDRLPIRMISPLRTYQVTPLASRNRVIRRVTSSTVPIASPVSITSPTPYWSSMIMNTPERKSLTRLCAPKPSATPATPADASSGASGMPSRAMIVSTARVTTTKVTMLRSSDPTVSTRWRWRSLSNPAALARTRPARPDSASRWADFEVIVTTTRLISRRSSQRLIAARTMVARIRSPTVASQTCVFSQVRLMPSRLRSGACRSAVADSVTRVPLLGGWRAHHRVAVLDDEAAQRGVGVGGGVEPGLGALQELAVGDGAGVEPADDGLDHGVRAALLDRVEQGVVALDERAQQLSRGAGAGETQGQGVY